MYYAIVVAVHATADAAADATADAAAANQRDDAAARSPLVCDTKSRGSSSRAPGMFQQESQPFFSFISKPHPVQRWGVSGGGRCVCDEV